MGTVFEPNGISIWFKNCHHDHIPFDVKGNGNIVFSVKNDCIETRKIKIECVITKNNYTIIDNYKF